MRISLQRMICVAIVAFFVTTSGVSAQPIQFDKDTKSAFDVELRLPQFKNGEDQNITGSKLIISLRQRVSNDLRLVCSLPLAHTSYEYGYYYRSEESEDVIGNLYLGMEGGGIKSPLLYDFGVSLPTAGNDQINASIVGIMSDIARFADFAPEYTIFHCRIGYYLKTPQNIVFQAKAGPVVWLNTGGSEYDSRNNTELFYNYEGELWYKADRFGLGAGISGIVIMSDEELLGESRNVTEMGFGANATFGHVTPGLFCKIPLSKSLSEIIDVTYGLNLQVKL